MSDSWLSTNPNTFNMTLSSSTAQDPRICLFCNSADGDWGSLRKPAVAAFMRHSALAQFDCSEVHIIRLHHTQGEFSLTLGVFYYAGDMTFLLRCIWSQMTCTKVYIKHCMKSKFPGINFPLPLPIAVSSLFATARTKKIDVLGEDRTYKKCVNSVD